MNNIGSLFVKCAVIENPELIAFNKIFGKNYYISSSAFLSNENNKYLNKYFDSSMITNKLANIYEEYKKARLEQDKVKNSDKEIDKINEFEK